VLIYKIALADDWRAADKADEFAGSSKDKEDGFIHFSTAAQLRETLKLHYNTAAGVLVILAIDAGALGEALKWEPARNGDLFPHLYGRLPSSAVRTSLASHYASLADSDFAILRELIESRGGFDKS
jgi:uncharacterized protein (DUF952 family)